MRSSVDHRGLYRSRSQNLDIIPSIMGSWGGASGDMIGFVFQKDPFDHRMDSGLEGAKVKTEVQLG